MRNNKKIRKESYYHHQHLPLILVVGLIVGAVYMHINNKCVSLGREITLQEKQILKISKQLVIENERWATLTAPRNLERTIYRHDLNMVMPESAQIIHEEYWNKNAQTLNLGEERVF